MINSKINVTQNELFYLTLLYVCVCVFACMHRVCVCVCAKMGSVGQKMCFSQRYLCACCMMKVEMSQFMHNVKIKVNSVCGCVIVWCFCLCIYVHTHTCTHAHTTCMHAYYTCTNTTQAQGVKERVGWWQKWNSEWTHLLQKHLFSNCIKYI